MLTDLYQIETYFGAHAAVLSWEELAQKYETPIIEKALRCGDLKCKCLRCGPAKGTSVFWLSDTGRAKVKNRAL